jgi:hypothetical protein
VTDIDSVRHAGWRRLDGKPGYHRRMSEELFVPDDFAVPGGLTAAEFRMAPLGPQYNEADYAAWTASIDHIRAAPGFGESGWPHQMSPDDNLRDLERHAEDFAGCRRFTCTVLSSGTGDVIGCVYIYPPRRQGRPGRQRRKPAGRVGKVLGARRPRHARRGPGMAGTRLAIRLDRVRPADLTLATARAPSGTAAGR